MSSIENQIKEMTVDQHYDNIDKNMSIGCGEPFKREMIKLIDLYLENMNAHFELAYKPVMKAKREILKEIAEDMDIVAAKHEGDKDLIKLQVKLKGLSI